VLGLFVPLVAIAIFNVLLVYRMRVLNRNKQKAGVQRMRRLTDVARMVLAVVIIFAVCQLPYHVIEIISLQVVAVNKDRFNEISFNIFQLKGLKNNFYYHSATGSIARLMKKRSILSLSVDRIFYLIRNKGRI